jgi:probable HAF family extracellular repeat protein
VKRQDKGPVVGDSLSCDGSAHHAFLWEDGELVDLDSLIPPGSTLELVGTRNRDVR